MSLILGSAAAKAIGLAVMPVLTRLYDPADFGRLSLYVSVTTIIGSVLTLRYVVALPIPTSAFRARALLLLNTILIVGMTAAMLLISLVLLKTGASDLLLGRLDGFWTHYWWLVPIGGAGFASYELLTMWATREKQYSAISRSQVWQTISGTVFKVAGGFYAPGPLSLIVGQLVQQSGGILGILKSYFRAIRKSAASFTPRHLSLVFLRHLEFAYYKLPSHFIYSLAAQTPIIFSSYMWGSSTTGQLGLAFQAIAVPLMLISQNASRVYYAELAATGRRDCETALKLTRYMAVRLFAIGLLIAAGIFIVAPSIFTLAFGNNWLEAGEFARALSIYIPFQFVASPLIMAYNIYGNQKQVLALHCIRAALVVGVFAICYRIGLSAISTIYVYSVVISAHYTFVFFDVVRSIRNQR
ncbi:oligosaccharide flippase family protein [Stenotrophomonas sp. NPDC078853]|uniref:oligosaccharide flippase family protein n=1 Tax=Stenotrophomonas sp. NPDC078853 TaxID=3364534 RepID=UPI00384AFE8C